MTPGMKADLSKGTLVALITTVLAFGALNFAPAAPVAVAQSTVNITINNFAFSPNNITVVIGVNNTVTWTMDQTGVPYHTVTPNPGDPAGSWGSGELTTGHTYTFSFTVPGTYGYHCSLHTYMMGTVVVKAASGSTTTSSGSVPAFPFVAAGVAGFVFALLAAYLLVRQRQSPMARPKARHTQNPI
jgi:plastocyanin